MFSRSGPRTMRSSARLESRPDRAVRYAALHAAMSRWSRSAADGRPGRCKEVHARLTIRVARMIASPYTAVPAPSDRQSDIAFQHPLLEARPLARSPQLGDMRDTVAYRPAVRARAAADGPRDAHELGSHRVPGEAHRRIAVAAHVDELEMRRKLRVRERACALEVEALRIFEARPDAMPQQHIVGPVRLPAIRPVSEKQGADRRVFG